MKFLVATTLALSVLASGAVATAAPPYGSSYGCSTGYGSNNSQYGYGSQYNYAPQSYYGSAQSYGGYQNVQRYPQSSPYEQSWNVTSFRSPSYTYDPVHGDYHVNSTYQPRPFNQNFGGHHSAYGHQHGGNRGW